MTKFIIFVLLAITPFTLFTDQNKQGEISNGDSLLLDMIKKVVSSNDDVTKTNLMNDFHHRIENMSVSDRSRLNSSIIKNVSFLLFDGNAYIRSSAARTLGDIGQAACSEKPSLEKALYDEEHPSGVFKVFPSHGNERVLREVISSMQCN